jgi:hypothetical protein
VPTNAELCYRNQDISSASFCACRRVLAEITPEPVITQDPVARAHAFERIIDRLEAVKPADVRLVAVQREEHPLTLGLRVEAHVNATVAEGSANMSFSAGAVGGTL